LRSKGEDMYIEEELYSKFVELMPIACIDVLIHDDDGNILLVKRNQEPAKDKWWVIGGRLLKEETMLDGAVRKAKEEVGLDVKVEKLIGVYDEFFDTSIQGYPTHTVCIAFLAKADNLLMTDVDYTCDGFKLVSSVDNSYDKYLLRVVKDSGILERK